MAAAEADERDHLIAVVQEEDEDKAQRDEEDAEADPDPTLNSLRESQDSATSTNNDSAKQDEPKSGYSCELASSL